MKIYYSSSFAREYELLHSKLCSILASSASTFLTPSSVRPGGRFSVIKNKRLTSDVWKLAEKKEKIFRKDPFDPSLKTHKLTGKLRNYWSFSIDYHLRIVFRFITKDTVLLLDIGTHEIYR